VLIFSQFKAMLGILERYLTLVGLSFVRIDGLILSHLISSNPI
jgi:SNF2 family DNA or RNA helicase